MARARVKSASTRPRSRNAVKAAPRRKIGRYVVLALLAAPAAIALHKMNWSALVPAISMPQVSIPKLSLPKVAASAFSLPNVSVPAVAVKQDAPIRNVVVEGSLRYLDRTQFQEELSARLHGDFVRLNLNDLKAAIQENLWIKRVDVRRVWPSTLQVNIEEEQPIALWGERAFVNRYGELVTLPDSSSLAHLPILVGEDARALEITKEYLTMGRLLGDYGLVITRLEVDHTGSWTLNLNREFDLVLGEKQISERLSRFVYLYQAQLADRNTVLEKVDMRYQNGIAVKWKTGAKLVANSETTFANR